MLHDAAKKALTKSSRETPLENETVFSTRQVLYSETSVEATWPHALQASQSNRVLRSYRNLRSRQCEDVLLPRASACLTSLTSTDWSAERGGNLQPGGPSATFRTCMFAKSWRGETKLGVPSPVACFALEVLKRAAGICRDWSMRRSHGCLRSLSRPWLELWRLRLSACSVQL